MIAGRVVSCGGETSGSTYRNECYDYHPTNGWTQIGDYPKALWEHCLQLRPRLGWLLLRWMEINADTDSGMEHQNKPNLVDLRDEKLTCSENQTNKK